MLLLVLVMVTMRATAVEEDTTTELEAYTEDWFTTPSESENLNSLKCRELDPSVPSPCAFLCGGCPKGRICCRNNCGGIECMEPAKLHIPTEKEDIATTDIYQDWTYSVPTESSPTNHPEYTPKCPPVRLNLSLPCGDYLHCEDDWSCPGDKICCPIECGGMECKDPVIMDPLPQVDEEDSTISFTTEIPEAWTTREPVRPQYNPMCPPAHVNLSRPCGEFPLCQDDEACSENKICCPNDCGGVECTYPLIKGPPPLIGDVVKISETESTTQTAEDPTPEVYIFPFMVHGPGSFCPKLDPEAPALCEDTCNPWRSSCPMGQVCCLNNCGAGECMNAIYTEDPAEDENERFTPKIEDPYDKIPEPEYDEISSEDSRTPIMEWSPLCPKLDLRDPEPCRAMCSPLEDSCPEGRVCCRNKCGYGECKDAVVKEQPAQKEKEKFFWDLYAKNTVHQFEKNVVT